MAIAYGKQPSGHAQTGYTWTSSRTAKAFRRPLSHRIWVYFVGAVLVTAVVLAVLLTSGVLSLEAHAPIVITTAMVGSVVGSMAAFFLIPGLFLRAAKHGAYQSRGLVVATDRGGGMEDYHYNQRAIIRVEHDGQRYLFYADQAGLMVDYGDRVLVSWHGPKSTVCWIHQDHA